MHNNTQTSPVASISATPAARAPAPAPPPAPPPQKRKRSAEGPVTPPLSATDAGSSHILTTAVNVLSIEATALSHVSRLYQTDPAARDGLVQAVESVVRAHQSRGKIIVCGIGKSGLVGMKTTATMKSLGIRCAFMHAAEAIHGDLGDIQPDDVVLFITFSGRTPELLAILPHLPAATTVIALTGHTKAGACPLLHDRSNAIVLPAPIHEREEDSFGVAAPTTSTTVAMAVGDMLALAAADALHQGATRDVFLRNHPGGAIGKKAKFEQREDIQDVGVIAQ
ncbi:SIS domain-containing protein [Pseudovirgaria hyperparasitica]|uniref:SIS domain-containing protein n=1 Tax=Pseudovirgaria hyperparasitica TaxID=470096 RepID=A0A6A6WFN6_9PEZI|nr:SIS domain-containing protein [Pseudovirgaria hyperparasitica]KAF2760407.1 SIS domain-containing protein [Pseudovirgaria hyperparasitica]